MYRELTSKMLTIGEVRISSSTHAFITLYLLSKSLHLGEVSKSLGTTQSTICLSSREEKDFRSPNKLPFICTLSPLKKETTDCKSVVFLKKECQHIVRAYVNFTFPFFFATCCSHNRNFSKLQANESLSRI